jgi:hypothetical protein
MRPMKLIKTERIIIFVAFPVQIYFILSGASAPRFGFK